ncbi:helix-turn-helix transcriptional regulator [Qipengyuania aquimaris]|uniref:LuxR family transcriptional regulator n=1 Tax=Qipengyuania aquimaris TaxID=255984 RepID=A0A9Q3XDR0_9SPHN|nr:LuxR family transcriptional regulator [Qipengyuania aquimaris]MBY6218006.1 LuxR family transcriptional regulator [Qipengyuania aquimaris]
MEAFFTEIAESPDVGSLWDSLKKAAATYGADKFSYHFTPVFASQVSRETQVMAEGFSLAWLDLYESADFRSVDPIPDVVMKAGHTISWDEALEQVEHSPEVEAFVSAMQEYGIVNGFGVPLYGPDDRDAYGAFGFPEGHVPEVEQIVALTIIARAAHDRVCQLVNVEEGEIAFSRREAEVLELIAQGKSNPIIAQVLGISPDTVSTYVRRIYAKLGASDRVGAVIKALKLKLISL